MVDLSLIFHSYGTLYQRLPEAPQLHRTSASKQSWRKSGANFGCPIHGEPTWNHGKIYENLLYFMDDLGVAPWHIPIPTQSKMPLLQDFHIQKKNLCCFFFHVHQAYFSFFVADTKQIPSPSSPKMPWHWPSGWLWACDPQASCRAWLDRDLPERMRSIWWLIMAI